MIRRPPIRKFLVLLWMLFPVAVAGYHFNEGPKQMARERAYLKLLDIRRMERQKEPDWQEIVAQYNGLLEELPHDEDPLVLCEIRLAIGTARLEMLDLETAITDLTLLLQETAAVYGENARITRGVREQLGKAHYYATWVLKTNGAPESQWRPFADRARQLFRYLAELNDPEAFRHYENRVREEFDKASKRNLPAGRSPADQQSSLPEGGKSADSRDLASLSTTAADIQAGLPGPEASHITNQR